MNAPDIDLTDREVDLLFGRICRHEEPRRHSLGGRIVRPAPAFAVTAVQHGRMRELARRVRYSPAAAAADLRRVVHGSTSYRALWLVGAMAGGGALAAVTGAVTR